MQTPILRVIKDFPKILKRNIGVTASVLQSDPIQQLFVEKIREYRKKSEGGKMVEMSPEMERTMKNDLLRLEKQYDTAGKDMTKFPTLNFTEPKFDPINMGDQ